jgi:hypothetical protein
LTPGRRQRLYRVEVWRGTPHSAGAKMVAVEAVLAEHRGQARARATQAVRDRRGDASDLDYQAIAELAQWRDI